MRSGYVFSYNGGESIDEVYGDDNYVDLGERGVDTRLGRLNWSIDPKASEYPWQSPYAYFANSPIWQIDFNGEGAGDFYSKDGTHLGSDGINDDKAYVADDVKKDDKGNVTEATNKQELKFKNSEVIKLAAVVYGEADAKTNNKEEKFGIASASINNFNVRGGKTSLSKVLSEISNATFDGNARYGAYNNASSEEKNSNTQMKISTAAAINAMTGGTDYSNGATGWDGRDLKTNSHRFGLNITDPKHDIYKVGDRPFKTKQLGSYYSRQTTAAHGKTVFMRIHPQWIKGGGRRW